MNPHEQLSRIANGQYSVFTRAQALQVGLSDGWLASQVRRGSLVKVHRSVYVPSVVVVGAEQRVIAACLACGAHAAASHQSAAFVWGFTDDVTTPHVTVPASTSKRQPEIVVHRTAHLETTRHRGFPVTTVMRTLLDLVDVLPVGEVEQVMDAAHRRRLIHPVRFADYLALPANLAKPGTGELRRLVAMRDPRRPIGSDLETVFFQVLRDVNVPLPATQYPVQIGGERRFIDFAYPSARLAIEIDGFETHGTRQAFEDDRARQNDLEELGWGFRRFTMRMIASDPVGVAFTVARGIGLVPSRWRQAARKSSRRSGSAGIKRAM